MASNSKKTKTRRKRRDKKIAEARHKKIQKRLAADIKAENIVVAN